jgi:hypothetical protein
MRSDSAQHRVWNNSCYPLVVYLYDQDLILIENILLERTGVKDTIKIGNSVGQFVQRVSKLDDGDLIADIP